MTTDTPRTHIFGTPNDSVAPEELLKRNTTTDTPRTDAYNNSLGVVPADFARQLERELNELWSRFDKQMEAEAEVERLTGRMKEAEDRIEGLHEGWKKARKAHLKTCKNAQAEINKLHTKNVCLQELIQELYEWTRRDYPTESEVREIMNRYHDLNK